MDGITHGKLSYKNMEGTLPRRNPSTPEVTSVWTLIRKVLERMVQNGQDLL